jgi:hypothetical protein
MWRNACPPDVPGDRLDLRLLGLLDEAPSIAMAGRPEYRDAVHGLVTATAYVAR